MKQVEKGRWKPVDPGLPDKKKWLFEECSDAGVVSVWSRVQMICITNYGPADAADTPSTFASLIS